MSRVVKFCYRFGGQIRHEPSCLLGERKPLARDSTLSAFKETTMTVVQSIGISRWHLGFGAVSTLRIFLWKSLPERLKDRILIFNSFFSR